MKSTTKKILRVTGWSLLLIELLLMAGVGFIESTSGKIWLSHTISRFASDPAAKTFVTIEGIEGELPWDIHVAAIRFSDAAGDYATIRGLHLSWNPVALLKKHIDIHALEVAAISLARMPLPPAMPAKTQSKPFSLPHLPRLTMGRLAIGAIHIAAPVTGAAQDMTLGGGGTFEDYRLTLKTLSGPETSLALALNLLPQSLRVHAAFDEAPGGIVLHLLKQPDTAAMHLTLEAATDATGILQVERANLSLGAATLSGSGEYALGDGVVKATLDVRVPDAAQFSVVTATQLKGNVTGHVALRGPPVAIAAQIDAALKDFSSGNTAIPAASAHAEGVVNSVTNGARFHLKTDAVLNSVPVALEMQGDAHAMQLNLTSLDAVYGIYRAHAEGTVDAKRRSFDLTLKSALPPLATLAPELHADGEADASAHLQGTFDRFSVAAQVKLASREGDAQVKADGEVDAKKQGFDGKVTGEFLRAGHRFALSVPMKADTKEASVNDATLKGDGISVSARLRWQVAQASGQVKISVDAPDLKPLGQLLGQELSGHATLDAELMPHGNDESVSLKGSAGDIAMNGITLGKAELAATVQDVKALNAVDASLTATTLTSGATQVEAVNAQIKGGLSSRIALKAAASGNEARHPFSLKLEGDAERDRGSAPRTRIALAKLQGNYDTSPIALAAPAQLVVTGGEFELSPLALTLAGGNVTANGSMTPQKVAARLSVNHIRLERVPGAGLPEGSVDAGVLLSGDPKAPMASLQSTLSLNSGEHPLIMRVKGEWRKNVLAVHASATMDKAKLATDIEAKAAFSLWPFVAGLNAASPVEGSASLEANLDTFNAFLRSGGQQIGGQILGKAKLAGTLARPEVTGHATLSDGRYAFDDAGICIKGMSASLSGSGDHVVLDEMKAPSAEGGMLQAKASVSLGGARTVQGSVDFTRYRMFCGGVASGSIDGKLTASGALDAAQLKGTLTFPQMNIVLPGAAPKQAPIPKVQTVRVDPATGKPKPVAPVKPGTGGGPTLAIAVHVPNRMFVQGRGLNAEFSGDLNIAGPAINPVVSGQFATKRGSFELLDRKLALTNAVLRFDGPIPPSPFLDVEAQSTVTPTSGTATTITVALSGPAGKPEFTFSSTPALPQDEILAMLLFNRSLSSLGPFQVAQLAQATAELAGYGGGPGVLGKVQSLLGIDTLNVGTDSDNNVNVGAGKYITDKIYVGVTQGAKPDSRAVTTEIEVYPHVSTTTGVSANGQQNLGMQWKYDY